MLAVAGKRKRKQRAVGASLFDAICGGTVAGAGGEAAGPPAPLPGLALLHSDSFKEKREVGSFTLRVPQGGKCCKLTKVGCDRGKRVTERKRGKVHGLSPAAGLRLRRSMLAVDVGAIETPFFISNTIPLINGVAEFGWPDMRRFLRLYRQRFERKFPGVSAHWVKELTAKGSPHLHIVVPWPVGQAPKLDEFRKWNDDAWAEVVRSSHPKHRDVGCNVQLLRSWEGGVSYLSCYLSAGSAEDPRTEDSGKMWGIIGRKYLPVTWLPEVELTEAEGKFVQRQLLHLQRKKRQRWLVSEQSHSCEKNRGKPVKWRRVRAQQAWDAKFVNTSILSDAQMNAVYADCAPSVVLSLEQQLCNYREWGFKVKKLIPSCCRRKVVAVWSVDEHSGKVEKSYEEMHSFSSGWHHIGAADVLRLVAWVKAHGAHGAASVASVRKVKHVEGFSTSSQEESEVADFSFA